MFINKKKYLFVSRKHLEIEIKITMIIVFIYAVALFRETESCVRKYTPLLDFSPSRFYGVHIVRKRETLY